MKRLLNLLLTLAVFSSAMAGTVNRQQARETAAKFMQQKGIRLDEASQQGKKTPAAEQPVYVFNAIEGQGFVVVSGDDRTDAILGYTTQGTYDEDNLPPALKEWMEQMTIEIEVLQQQPAEARAANAPKAVPQQVAIHAPISPLILTTWNQGNTYKKQNNNTDGIYNFMLPKDGSYYPCTGCVATAGAQIMYYFKCPQGPTAVVPGYKNDNSNVNTSKDLPATTFKWNDMKTSYSSSDAYTDAAKAVAELMLYAGYAAHMRYASDGSSANQMQLARGMAEYFGYDPYSLSYVKRSDYSVVEWDELMYNELANGRPIIYDGNKNADGSGGHAFLCDGYDGAGLYHFNWGWGGSSNGYFKLQATNPDGPNGYPGYIFGNSAVIGIQPNTGIVPVDPNANDEWETPVIEGLVASVDFNGIEGTTVTLGMWNKNGQDCNFGFGIGELLEDGSIVVIDNKYESSINTSLPNGYGWNSRQFDFSSYQEKLTKGKHKLVPISLLKDETEWKRCKPADLWFEVNVDGGDMTIVRHPVVDIQVNKFEMVSNGMPGNWQKVLVNMTNNGDNYEKKFYIMVNNEWPGWTSSVKELKIAAGNTKEFYLETGELSKGHYKLTLLNGWNGPVVATQEVDIKQDLQATNFTVGGDIRFAGTTLPIDVTVENHAGDNTIPLYLFASQYSGSKGNCVYAAGTGIPAGGSEDVRFYFKPTSAGTWYLRVSTDANGNNIIGEGSVGVENAPSGTVKLQLTGKKVICRPNGKAIFQMTVKNTGTVTNYRGFRSWLYAPKNDGSGSWSGNQFQSAPDVIIEPGQEANVSLTYDGLTEGNEYAASLQYATTYSSDNWTDLNSLWDNKFVYHAPEEVPGDFSGNGSPDAEDVDILLNYLISGTAPDGFDAGSADLNGDTKVDISDIVFLISKILAPKEE